MSLSFFEKPILNSPYAYPGRHWVLDEDGQLQAQRQMLAGTSRQWLKVVVVMGGLRA